MNRPRASVLAVALAAASILLTACDEEGEDLAALPSVSGDEVGVVDDDFEPAHLEVPAGGSVTWVWDASRSHNVVGDDFESDLQEEGTFTHTFAEPGTYDYACTIHSGMTGRITVTAG